DKYRSYSLNPGSKNRKIQLFKNFRSRKTVIDGVNFIFQQIMSQNVGELDYDDAEALRLGAIFKDNEEDKAPGGHPVEFCIVDMKDDSPVEEQFYEDSLDIIQTEGRIVARRIMELVSGGQFKYRDIVILLRTTVNWAETFADELAIQGIPAYSDSGTGYFKTIEVQTVLALLQIIDNPMQDIPLLAVLRSPIGSWSPEELIDIRLMDRESTVYEALVKMGQEGKGSISEKANEFIQTLNKWRDMSFYLPTDELIWYLYGETGYYSCVGVMPGGAQRQANLRILFQRAGQYEETSYKGLFNFIQFIDKLRTSQGDMGSAKILGENENVVRIMSIHKSKGLEFPVVFLSGCGKQFNFMDTTRNILFHQDLGLGPDYVDCHRRTTYATLAKQALKYKITLETLSEEMRILYVAMTRARERLIISGGVKDLEKEIKSWANALATEELKLPEYQMMGARRYLDWIGPSIIRHEDGKVLRQLVDMPVVNEDSLMVDESRWEIKLYNKLDAMVVNLKEEDDGDSQGVLWDIDDGDQLSIHRQIYDRLEWEYPHLEASKLPVKVSVTELKSYLDGNLSSDILDETGASPLIMPTLVKRPGFLEEEAKAMTSAERGSLLHFVLQHLNLDRELSKENIRDGINRMAEVQLITEEQAEAVDVPRIERFFNSPLGIRMLKAGGIKREVPFTMEIPSSQIYPESSGKPHGDDGIILQGIMDCYFEEPGGIVLVDYKTDYVALDGGLKTIKGRYSSQMNYYTYALERITGKKVIGKYVYLFWNGQVLEY
ncbi:MAG TPA: helicase-exonuclease AddAB subunit AddA, partial [Clostridia bacterium]|nr:helicase-exonuclease AddAB subunit AddA [Clostridia bacterium]